MMCPEIRFKDDPIFIANYICFLGKHIQNGFYQEHEYRVLPILFPHNFSIYFPDLSYSNSFWRQIKNCKHSSLAQPFPKKAVTEVSSKLPTSQETPYSLDTNTFWQTIKKLHLFDKELTKIRSITFYPTRFGTIGSFHFQPKNPTVDIVATIRSDQPPEQAFWTILNCLILLKDPDFGYIKWSERKAIVDFLIKNTGLDKLIPKINYRPFPPETISQSNGYLQKLGFGPKPKIIKQGGEILINNKLARRHLSKQEFAVFEELFNGPLTGDQIFDLAHPGNIDDFSLWSVTRLIYRLRSKLKKLGVPQTHLICKRNEGYCLER